MQTPHGSLWAQPCTGCSAWLCTFSRSERWASASAKGGELFSAQFTWSISPLLIYKPPAPTAKHPGLFETESPVCKRKITAQQRQASSKQHTDVKILVCCQVTGARENRKPIGLGAGVHTHDSHTQDAETGGLPWILGQPGLHSGRLPHQTETPRPNRLRLDGASSASACLPTHCNSCRR